MKSLNVRVDDHLNIEEFIEADKRASNGRRNKPEILRFNANRTENLFKIMDVIRDGKYQPSKYRRFMIYDPKEREILSLPFCDRIVHQWYIEEFIKPYYIPRFIKDTYACIPERGLHQAVNVIQRYMRIMNRKYDGHYYIMKMDISKFFYNIDKNIIYEILSSKIADSKLRQLTKVIIFDGDEHTGLPIGNYVSQYFANIYLNELDQYCKQTLRIKYYVRYMDDFIILAPDKKTASEWYEKIDNFVNTRLKLKLNPKSRYYPARFGLEFVGYRIFNDYRLIKKRSKRKIKAIIADYQSGVDPPERFVQRVNSWHGHVAHADTRHYTCQALLKYWMMLPIVFPEIFKTKNNIDNKIKAEEKA